MMDASEVNRKEQNRGPRLGFTSEILRGVGDARLCDEEDHGRGLNHDMVGLEVGRVAVVDEATKASVERGIGLERHFIQGHHLQGRRQVAGQRVAHQGAR